MYGCFFCYRYKKSELLDLFFFQCNVILFFGGKMCCSFVLVYYVLEGFDVVWVVVLEFQVVSVFLDVQVDNWEVGSVGNGFVYQWGILVGGGDNGQFIIFQDQLCLVGVEMGSSGFFEFCFEVFYGIEIVFDSCFQVVLQGGIGFQVFLEQVVVCVVVGVVMQYGFFVSWQLIQFGNQFFSGQVSEFWQVFQCGVGIVYVGLVVFSVMDFYCLFVEVWFQSIVSVRQGWQGIVYNYFYYC